MLINNALSLVTKQPTVPYVYYLKTADIRVLEGFNTLGQWTNNYPAGGTLTSDSENYKEGSQGIKLTVTSVGSEVYATKVINYTSSNDNKFIIWVYLHDVTANYYAIQLFMSSTTDFSKYFITGIAATKQGWNSFLIDSTSWNAAGGESWSNTFVRLRIKIKANAGLTCAVTFDNMQYKLNGKPKCILTFDDASKGVYTNAFPYMKARGIKGVTYAIPSRVDTTGFCTLNDLKEMYADGWNIGNHTYNHYDMTTLGTEAQCESEIQDTTTWLITNGFTKGCRHFAVPNGATNANVFQAIANSNLKTARNSVDGFEYPYNSNILALHEKPIFMNSSLASIIAHVDTAISNGNTVIFMLHDVLPVASNTYIWSTANFQGLVDYLVSSGISVITLEEWYDNLIQTYEYT